MGGAAGRADRELSQLGAVVGGLQHRPLAAQQLGQRQAAVDRGLGVVGEQDQRVLVEEGSIPPAASSRIPKQSSARAIDSTLALGPLRCE